MKLKKLAKSLIALVLAAVIAAQPSVRAFAADSGEQYVSEIKIGVGKNAEEALASLQGYVILKDDSGNYVDLNKNAGGGLGSKGDRVVYLGYKKTSNRSEAVTDLAVMNMKGGYSIEDYEALMETQMKEQIIPFVERFLVAIEEYRANCSSSNAANRQRAEYIRDVLNKFTDDDCGGAGLGDLLLNETKYEMGDAAYNALSDTEKKKHADILTIIAQSNGQATLMMSNLLTRAADTADDTWIDRLSDLTFDDLADELGLAPSKARSELSKVYYDDAMIILEMWDTFKNQLENYDEAVAKLEETEAVDFSDEDAAVAAFDPENMTEATAGAFGEAVAEINGNTEIYSNCYVDVACKEFLESIEYDDGTLLDYFTQDYEDVADDVSVLYPLVASLSAGQRAGLRFITLEDLVAIGATDGSGYGDSDLDMLEETSIYEGVDRGIYEKGGVALTSEALRRNASIRSQDDKTSPLISSWSCISYALTAGTAVAFGVTVSVRSGVNAALKAYLTPLKQAYSAMKEATKNLKGLYRMTEGNEAFLTNHQQAFTSLEEKIIAAKSEIERLTNPDLYARLAARSTLCNRLMVGLGVATVILMAVSALLTYRDLVNHYKVEFTPIPRYMVDAKDITTYNSKGEKLVLKNQSAYYKAALCDRSSDSDYYEIVGNVGDLNGYVGKQWLALYAERNEAKDPILADSFKVTSDTQIPAGYTSAIHPFGTTAAENLNNPMYVWNASAPKIYVYFKLDVGAASSAGSGFSTGSLALGALGGVVIGVLGTAILMKVSRKKKEKTAS